MILAALVGLAIGDVVSPFEPYWVTGEYSGTTMCPVCEYAMQPMIFVWSNNAPSSALSAVLNAVDKGGKGLEPNAVRTFLVDANPQNNDKLAFSRVSELSKSLKLPSVAFTYRPAKLKSALQNVKLQDSKGWTTMVYLVKNREVVERFLDPKEGDLKAIEAATRKLPVR